MPSLASLLIPAVVLLLLCIGSIVLFLVVMLRNEARHKKQVEALVAELEAANRQLRILDRMKSEFVSIASHQLRSPLTSIRGYASMLLEGSYGKIPVKARDAIERISESSRFMALSVEDYLNVSRIQAGNMKYTYAEIDMCDAAEHIAEASRPPALKKGLLLLFKTNITGSSMVRADIGKTRQIIDNLVNNALKYTLEGSITILVHDDPKRARVYVDVIDTGIGMEPEVIAGLFEKFQRARNANEVDVTGTGLGLYIAQKMAREMGGEVSGISRGRGKGSTFRFEMPTVPSKKRRSK